MATVDSDKAVCGVIHAMTVAVLVVFWVTRSKVQVKVALNVSMISDHFLKSYIPQSLHILQSN
jgi:hypothetical protein